MVRHGRSNGGWCRAGQGKAAHNGAVGYGLSPVPRKGRTGEARGDKKARALFGKLPGRFDNGKASSKGVCPFRAANVVSCGARGAAGKSGAE